MRSNLQNLLFQFLNSIGFLTRIPPRLPGEQASFSLKDCLWSFPLVGLFIGSLGALLFALLQWLGFNLALTVILVLTLTIAVTGALHEDGLADFCDGLGVLDPERSLAAMRDSRVGTFGVIGLVLSLLWRFAALYQIESIGFVACALMASHAGARGLMAPLFLLPFAGQKGLAYAAGRAGRSSVISALLVTMIILLLLMPLGLAFLTIVFGLGVVGLVGYMAMQKFGGVTGDVYGAAEQLAELAILAVLVMMLV